MAVPYFRMDGRLAIYCNEIPRALAESVFEAENASTVAGLGRALDAGRPQLARQASAARLARA